MGLAICKTDYHNVSLDVNGKLTIGIRLESKALETAWHGD